MFNTIQPTEEAIEIAIRNGEDMWGKYDVIETATDDLFLVQHKEDPSRCYGVTTIEGLERCSCPQFARAHVCNHQYFVAEWQKIEEGESIAEEKALAGIR